jgi:sugar (pentulose or hexulose) kinase
MQILADVTRLPLRVPAVVEAAALGAAILGGVAAGALDEDDAPRTMVRPGPRYTPDAAGVARYGALYERYRSLDDLLAPWFRDGASQDGVSQDGASQDGVSQDGAT